MAEHDSREHDDAVENADFCLPHVEVAVVRQLPGADRPKIAVLVENFPRAVDVDQLLMEQRGKHVRVILPRRFNA